MVIRYLVVILAAVSVVACGAFAADSPSGPSAAADRQRMLNLIPTPLPAQAVAQGPATFYEPDDLYKYMDGGADVFLLYGVQRLLHQEFRAKEVDVTVDVFDMGAPDTAFGMYSAERSPSYRFITMGAEGYRDEGILNFLQGRYYVKLGGFGSGADAVLDAFARALSPRIGPNPAFPPLLGQLPAEHRKPHSEQYMPKDPMGHAFLGPAYVIAYAAGDKESKLYVTVARDPADAQQRLKELDQNFRSTGESKPAPELGEGAIRASNSFEGSILARTKGRYLILLSNPGAGGEELLKATAERLR
jgi:hypothetical protein